MPGGHGHHADRRVMRESGPKCEQIVRREPDDRVHADWLLAVLFGRAGRSVLLQHRSRLRLRVRAARVRRCDLLRHSSSTYKSSANICVSGCVCVCDYVCDCVCDYVCVGPYEDICACSSGRGARVQVARRIRCAIWTRRRTYTLQQRAQRTVHGPNLDRRRHMRACGGRCRKTVRRESDENGCHAGWLRVVLCGRQLLLQQSKWNGSHQIHRFFLGSCVCAAGVRRCAWFYISENQSSTHMCLGVCACVCARGCARVFVSSFVCACACVCACVCACLCAFVCLYFCARYAGLAAAPEFKEQSNFALGPLNPLNPTSRIIDCPAETDPVRSPASCEVAAAVAGKPYGGSVSVNGIGSAETGMPVGCVWWSLGGSFYFNAYPPAHAAKLGVPFAQPVCAGAPRFKLRMQRIRVCMCVSTHVRFCLRPIPHTHPNRELNSKLSRYT
jgi:hypothetical protein